jgi:hypothetical protein
MLTAIGKGWQRLASRDGGSRLDVLGGVIVIASGVEGSPFGVASLRSPRFTAFIGFFGLDVAVPSALNLRRQRATGEQKAGEQRDG